MDKLKSVDNKMSTPNMVWDRKSGEPYGWFAVDNGYKGRLEFTLTWNKKDFDACPYWHFKKMSMDDCKKTVDG